MLEIIEKPDLSSWWKYINKMLNQANTDRKHPFRTCVMATTDGESVYQRTVVMRKFEQNVIQIFTDSRSNKIEQIKKLNSVSFLFWQPKHQVQLSIRCKIDQIENTIEPPNHILLEDYSTIQAPGKKISDFSLGWKRNQNEIYFTQLDCKILSVEMLVLNRGQHLKAIFELNPQIEMSWLVP